APLFTEAGSDVFKVRAVRQQKEEQRQQSGFALPGINAGNDSLKRGAGKDRKLSRRHVSEEGRERSLLRTAENPRHAEHGVRMIAEQQNGVVVHNTRI
ncbi:hypothetical protein TNCV_4914331, partial [Trichonephila clavipes]